MFVLVILCGALLQLAAEHFRVFSCFMLSCLAGFALSGFVTTSLGKNKLMLGFSFVTHVIRRNLSPFLLVSLLGYMQ